MHKIAVKVHFDAAHQIPGYPGECERLHGHRWEIEAVISTKELNAQGMVADFKILKSRLQTISKKLDHNYLNAILPELVPTAENLAEYIYRELASTIDASLKLEEVKVWESPNCWASFS